MKKNKMMRIASVLLVAVLISTCAIAGTYAKYVTKGEGTDTARVAKWGISVTASGETFAKEYAADDTSFTVATNTVVSTEKVVAPGTKGTVAAFTLAGKPEVAFRVEYAVTAVKSTNWTVDGAEYFPIVFKVNGTKVAFADLASAVAEFSKDYAANTDLSTIATDAPTITWEWPFYVDDATDAKDTWLGNQAAAGNPATLEITVTATVTQID